MHPFRAIVLLSLTSLPAAFTQDTTSSTVPDACKDICDPVVQLATACNMDAMGGMGTASNRNGWQIAKRNDEQDAEAQFKADCVCNNRSFDVGAVMGLCASCMGQQDGQTSQRSITEVGFLSNFVLAQGLYPDPDSHATVNN